MMNQQKQSDETIVGVLLAGGQSRRMGGGDKSLLDLGGQTMMHRVIARLAPQVSAMMINANGNSERFAQYALPIAPDTIEGHVGPLAGILTGMRWSIANAPSAQWIATVSTDAPFIPGNLVARLLDAVHNQPDAIAIARSQGNLHPVIGLWPIAHAEDLENALRDDGIRKVLRWTDKHGTVPVDFPIQMFGTEEIDPFFNANTPEELAKARDLIAHLA